MAYSPVRRAAYTLTSVLSHTKYLKENGYHLHTQTNITISSLLLGDKIAIDIPGSKIFVTIPKNATINKVLRVKNRGFSSLNGQPKGDLFVNLDLVLPKFAKTLQQTKVHRFVQIKIKRI